MFSDMNLLCAVSPNEIKKTLFRWWTLAQRPWKIYIVVLSMSIKRSHWLQWALIPGKICWGLWLGCFFWGALCSHKYSFYSHSPESKLLICIFVINTLTFCILFFTSSTEELITSLYAHAHTLLLRPFCLSQTHTCTTHSVHAILRVSDS